MLKLRISRRYLLIPVVLIVFFFLFFLIYDDIKKRTIAEFNNEQLILAQTASQGITTFFIDYQSNLTFLSQLNSIIDFSEEGKTIMAKFYENHKTIIEAITRVDAQGILQFTYPLNQSVIGKDISYQKHIQQVKATHQPVISDVFQSVQGYLAIALHVPVIEEKEYKGSLAILIPINRLGERYLGKIRIRGPGNVWLLSENGIEIYCPVSGHEGRSFLEITQNDFSAIKLVEKIKNEDHGTTKSIHQQVIIDGTAQFINKYVAFYRASLGNTYWTILISYQEKDIYTALTRLRNRLIFVFSLLFIVMLFYFYSFAKVSNVLKEEAKRKKAEKILHESEEKFRTIFEESPIGIELYEKNGRLITANKASLNIFGIPNVSEIQDFNIFDGTSLDAENKEKLKKGLPVTYQAKFDFDKVKELQQYKTLNTGIAYFDYTITPLLNTTGGVINGYLLQVQDISQRKHAEEEILMLAHALRSINECVSITDIENKILFVNEAFLKTYGYEYEELIGRNMDIFRSPGAPSQLIDSILPATINGGWQGELINIRKDGREFPIYLSTTIIKDKNGNAIGFIGVASDITNRKHNEQELIKAKEKAEESDRLKSAFLANMSHEIRTPMNGILGFADLLKEPDLTGEEQQKFVSIIENSGQRMLNIINDLIDISKIEVRQVILNNSATNIVELLNNLYSFFKPEMEKKGLEFIFRIKPDTDPIIVNTDKEKLYAILTNLLKNAIKYTPRGSVELGYQKTEETMHASSQLTFFVKDTGIGIPKDRQQAIFDRFVQADIEDKLAKEGAGLGLAISKAYAEMMGGNIRVDSDGNAGSIFWVTIPVLDVKSPEDNPIARDERTKSDFHKLKDLMVLIAEDEETSDFYLTEILKKECKEIFHTTTGKKTVELMKKNPEIQIILMDIKMPDMNGYEATRQIRQFNKDVIIIAQTAYALAGDREKSLEAGCNDYVTKPVKKSELFDKIKKNLPH